MGLLRVFKLLTASISGSGHKVRKVVGHSPSFGGTHGHKQGFTQMKPSSTAQKGIFVRGSMNEN